MGEGKLQTPNEGNLVTMQSEYAYVNKTKHKGGVQSALTSLLGFILVARIQLSLESRTKALSSSTQLWLGTKQAIIKAPPD